jgi:hypothetical protein
MKVGVKFMGQKGCDWLEKNKNKNKINIWNLNFFLKVGAKFGSP